MSEQQEKGGDVEARKVSQQSFTAALVVVGLGFGWCQWGITSQNTRIAVAEAKAEAAATAATTYNLSLSIQVAEVKSDVKWIRDKIEGLSEGPKPRR